MKKKYDWNAIQGEYDAGLSLRDLRTKHGVQMQALNKARKRGDLVTRTRPEAFSTYEKVHGHRPKNVMGEAARQRLSEEQTLRNRGGRCRWFEVQGVSVQGTWERDLAIKLEELGIKWEKISKSSGTFEYELDGKIRRYTPDFYLPEFDILIELKGYWWGDDRRKMAAVFEQHPNLRLIVVEKDEFLEAMSL